MALSLIPMSMGIALAIHSLIDKWALPGSEGQAPGSPEGTGPCAWLPSFTPPLHPALCPGGWPVWLAWTGALPSGFWSTLARGER